MNTKKLLSLLCALAMVLLCCTGCDGGSVDLFGLTITAKPIESEEDPVGEAEAEEKLITLSVTYDDGEEETFTIATEAEYLKEAVELALTIEGTTGDYGYTLTSVNGVTADFAAGDNAYWAIYVNGEYGMHSLDTQPVTDGDSYALVYESY